MAITRFVPLTRRGKTKFATVKWYNLCRQIIQLQTCYPLIYVTCKSRSKVWHIALQFLSVFLNLRIPREDAGGFKSRIRSPYSQRDVKDDLMGRCVGIAV